MAYWQFDLTFVNLGALPEGAHAIDFFLQSSRPVGGSLGAAGDIPATGNLDLTASTTAPDYGSPFELSSEDKAWFAVTVLDSAYPPETLASYLLGPYTVGDVGTEVPAP